MGRLSKLYNIEKIVIYQIFRRWNFKDDLGLRIAQELEDLSKALQDGLDYELDEAAYKKAYKEAEDNLTSEEFEKWKQRYTRVKISDDFWKQLKSLGTQYGTRYQELYDMRQDLIKPYRNERTGEIDTKFMSSTLLKQIRSIDSEMRRTQKKSRIDKMVEKVINKKE